jgi:hypothetical protein
MIVPIAANSYARRLRANPSLIIHQMFLRFKLVDRPLGKTFATLKKTSKKASAVKLLTFNGFSLPKAGGYDKRN